jgi:hypothetical protein
MQHIFFFVSRSDADRSECGVWQQIQSGHGRTWVNEQEKYFFYENDQPSRYTFDDDDDDAEEGSYRAPIPTPSPSIAAVDAVNSLMAEHVKVLIAEFSDSLTLMTTCFLMSSLSQHSRFRLQASHFRSLAQSRNRKLAAVHQAIVLASTSLRINWTIDRANMGSHIEETFAMLMRMSLPS